MKVKLKRKKHPFATTGDNRYVPWIESLPFCVNPRGQLIHRVRFAGTHFSNYDGRGPHSHDGCTYWCSNIGRGDFTDDPPADRLLCAYCEAKAVAHGEKTADELAGRHVHIGHLKPVRDCCKSEGN